jgi:Arc/MetJ-type ribon-helix-helix transcriptional regulator
LQGGGLAAPKGARQERSHRCENMVERADARCYDCIIDGIMNDASREAKTMSKNRTTVALPIELLDGIDEAVRSGRAGSRNAFLARAVRHELERLQREAIDRQFELMATDAHYQREARRISDEYARSDWEALRVAEDES